MTMQTTDRDEELDAGTSWGILLVIILVLIATVSMVAGAAQ